MKVYQLPPFAAVVFFSLVCLFAVSTLVALPIVLIQWVWNHLFAAFPVLPPIEVWQAGLLYVAFATIFYLSGFVRIEFEAQKND